MFVAFYKQLLTVKCINQFISIKKWKTLINRHAKKKKLREIVNKTARFRFYLKLYISKC